MADTGKKGKKKKGKGKTLNLNEFLSGGSGNVVSSFATKKTIDIEDNEPASNDVWEEEPKKQVFDLSKLPTAPRSSRSTDVKTLPTEPPYTAFLGNLAYDVEEEDIHEFFAELSLEKVRLPRDGGRLRGFGYAEFYNVESLAKAIKLNNEPLKGRNMRVDIAEHSGGGDGQGREDSREDRSSDWRRKEPGTAGEPERRPFDRPSRDGMGRGDRRDERDPSEADNASTWRRNSPVEPATDQRRNPVIRSQGSRPPGDSEADSASTWRRGPSEPAEESRRNFERTGFDGERGGFGRDRGGFDRERGGFDRERGGFDRERGGYDRERGGFDRGRGGFDRGGFDRGGFERNRGTDVAESDTSSSWRNEANVDTSQPSERPREESNARETREIPKERPKLNLKPRTVEPTKTDTNTSSSIFGGARPVDTATKEKQIEEKLIQERLQKEKAFHNATGRSDKEKRQEDEKIDRPSTDRENEDRDPEEEVRKDRTRVMRPDFSSEEPISPNKEEMSPVEKGGHATPDDKDQKDSGKKEKRRDHAPRVYEEPKAPVFGQKSLFSVLANDDEDDVDSGNEED